jgi:hypothetical protein
MFYDRSDPALHLSGVGNAATGIPSSSPITLPCTKASGSQDNALKLHVSAGLKQTGQWYADTAILEHP